MMRLMVAIAIVAIIAGFVLTPFVLFAYEWVYKYFFMNEQIDKRVKNKIKELKD